ncbi:unnamed protein product, partial [Musa acuminata var. zebrina]
LPSLCSSRRQGLPPRSIWGPTLSPSDPFSPTNEQVIGLLDSKMSLAVTSYIDQLLTFPISVRQHHVSSTAFSSLSSFIDQLELPAALSQLSST